MTVRIRNEPEQECRELDDEECDVELLKQGKLQQRWQSGAIDG